MKALFAVIQRPELLSSILLEFNNKGISGATVFESMGMGYLMAESAPIFARLSQVAMGSTAPSRTLMAIIEDHQVEMAVQIIEDVVGDLTQPNTGIVFTVPVDSIRGLRDAEGNYAV
ncbi:MAG: hypothetical protein GX977_13965 [Firmicutes bacterium]|nr:hypothetical protein [Bacillota bacterium]